MTDAAGTIVDRYAYDPFGRPAGHEGSTPNPFTFVGGLGVMAENGGLYFMRARSNDPDTGRFLGKDPVEGQPTNPLGFNRYPYGLNNPLVNVDPSGRWFLDSIVNVIVDVVEAAVDLVSPDPISTPPPTPAWDSSGANGGGGGVIKRTYGYSSPQELGESALQQWKQTQGSPETIYEQQHYIYKYATNTEVHDPPGPVISPEVCEGARQVAGYCATVGILTFRGATALGSVIYGPVATDGSCPFEDYASKPPYYPDELPWLGLAEYDGMSSAMDVAAFEYLTGTGRHSR